MRQSSKSGLFYSAALAGLLGVSAPTSVFAQATTAEKEKQEVVVVTATRRDQALQSTAIAVTAVGANEIARQNIVSTSDLVRAAPTLMIQSSNSETGGTSIRIRGVGTTGNNAGLEGAVGVFIDGVYRQRSGLAMNNLFDIARVEVLRGPQGTLFGKNTSAGAISVVPRAPQLDTKSGAFKIGYGNFDAVDIEGMVNMPLGDKLAIRIAGALQSRNGYVEDVLTLKDSYDKNRQLIRAGVTWAPTENITWRGTVDYATKDENCCTAFYKIIAGASNAQASLVPGAVLPKNPEDRLSITTPGRDFVEQTDDFGLSSHLTIDLGTMTFKNIIAHREFKAYNAIDADFGPADILYQKIDSEQTLDSFEATLNGKFGIVDWLVGGYYAKESVDQINQTRYGAQLANYIPLATGGLIPLATARALYPADGGIVNSVFAQESTSWSVFTHNQVQFTDRFGGVLGVRYNHEEKEGGMKSIITQSPSCGGGPFFGQGAAPPPGLPASLRLLCPRPTFFSTTDENEVTGTAGLNFRISDAIFTYASYSHGYKAGGINLDRDAGAATGVNAASGLVTGTQDQVNAAAKFAPEFSDSYELGVRAQFFNRRLTVNTTLFQTDYKDFQLNTFNGLGFTITNAGSVRSKGFETEGNFRLTPDLNFTFGVANTTAKYGFEPVLLVDPVDQLPAPNGDPPLAGQTLTHAPKWSGTVGANYERSITDAYKGFINVSASYRSDHNTGSDLVLAKVQPAFTLVNLRFGIFSEGTKDWELAFWVNNLTDVYYQQVAFDTVFQGGSLSEHGNPPRMYGVTFRKNF